VPPRVNLFGVQTEKYVSMPPEGESFFPRHHRQGIRKASRSLGPTQTETGEDSTGMLIGPRR